MPRAVVDANVWVSALLNPEGYPARVKAAAAAGEFVPILSPPLIAELADVLRRPRIRDRYGIREHHVLALLAMLSECAEMVEVIGHVHLCRDPDDDAVIETALVGQADMLVTR